MEFILVGRSVCVGSVMEPYRVTFYEALFFGKQRESSFLKGQHQERGEKKSRGRRVRASSLTSHQARKKISVYTTHIMV